MVRMVRALLITACCVVASTFPGVAAASRTVPFTLLHMNDLHGHILPYLDKTVREDTKVSGAAFFASVIERERAANPEGTLLLSAGDMFQGTPISNVFQGEPVIEIMNALRFDAMTLGNHEFDWGRDALDKLRTRAVFPFLAANIVGPGGGVLEGTKPYAMLKRRGIDIAVIGVTTPETRYATKPAHVADLTFLDPVAVLPEMIGKVRGEGAGLVIVLSHLGLEADQELARKVAGIDVIVGGHSHTAVTEPVRIDNTLIVQAGYYGIYVGVLGLEVDPETRKLTGYSTRDVLRPVLAGVEASSDPAVAALVERYAEKVKSEFARVVGSSEVDLLRQPMAESNVGNLIADAMREAGGADIGLQNGGGIRADLPAGDITLEQLYTLLPFDNVVVTMTLKGEHIREILETSGEQQTKILQISGLSVEYDLNRPAGSRVVQATVKGDPLRPDALYRVATNDFLVAGGDRFTAFKNGFDLVYGDPLRDVVAAYLKKYSPVKPAIENRIVIRN